MLADDDKDVLRFADAFLDGRAIDADVRERLGERLGEAGVAELGTALALFHGLSKMLIVLGLEPETMPTTVLAMPGSTNRAPGAT